MNSIQKILFASVLTVISVSQMKGQGTLTFQNLDFENGSFVAIPGDQYGSFQWTFAMPGWTGSVGTNQVDRLLHNNLFLSLAGIAIQGPDYPSANLYHAQNYLVLQAGLDPNNLQSSVGSAIAQTGTIPSGTQSIRLLSNNSFSLGFILLFGGNTIPLFNVGSSANGRPIWGGDVSSFAGQTGELRFQGAGYLDYIQFSSQTIPEPSMLGLFGLGALMFSHRMWRVAKS